MTLNEMLDKIVERKHLLILLLVIVLSVSFRMKTVHTDYVQTMADPWYFVRVAEDVANNNYIPPSWDTLSHFPPGRPFYVWLGWIYFIILVSIITNSSIMYAANIAPIIMVVFAGIFAYLLGKKLSNEWGGVIASILILTAPFYVTVSQGGYADTDAPVVALSLLSIYSIIVAYERRDWKGYIFAIISNFLFLVSWNTGYYPIFLMLLSAGIYVLKDLYRKDYAGAGKNVLFTLIIIIPSVLLAYLSGVNLLAQIIERLNWFEGEMIVTISVAELQRGNIINILHEAGGRIGFIPFLITMFGLPVYLFFKRKKLDYKDVFMTLWFVFMLYILSNGIRFTLLFSIPTLLLASKFIVHGFSLISKKYKSMAPFAFGAISLYMVISISFSLAFVHDYGIPEDWKNAMNWLKNNADKNAMVVTWWDPGHFITETTGLRVHADGAHCPPHECVVWNHNHRIRDAGRILSTENETEAVQLLKKYSRLPPEQCEYVKSIYPQMPDSACEPASEIYLLLSSDLLQKFVWLNYFGGYAHGDPDVLEISGGRGVIYPGQCKVDYNWAYCPWVATINDTGEGYISYKLGAFEFMLVEKNKKFYPFLLIGGDRFMIKNLIIKSEGGMDIALHYEKYNTTIPKIDGTLWTSPDMKTVLFLNPHIDDSIFVRGFLTSTGFEYLEKVFDSRDVKIYRLKNYDAE